MATIVAEALLSTSVELLLEKIVSGEFVDFFRSTKLDDSLLGKLKITLRSLRVVLNDAEEKQITNSDVKEWMDELRHAVFEAEDLFDEINTEALRCRVKAEHQSKTVSAKVRNILSSRFKQSYRVINSKMQKLFEKLEDFARNGHLLGLREGVSSSVWHGTPTSSVVVDESSIYGRDNDRKKLKEFLLSEDASDDGSKIGVISIVGMGGLGKTTLAKLLYNDEEVKEKFDLKGWAHISNDFDIVRVTKTLLEAVTPKSITNDNLNFLHQKYVNSKTIQKQFTKTLVDSITSETINNDNLNSDLDNLQVQLKRSLSNKTFLLVLDDIWYGRYVGWNNLSDIFNVGGMGSKIIITTRDERVALPMQNFLYVHHLKPLEPEDCWSLISRHAFVASNYQQRSNLEVIGKGIANKCKGLPLAATALGGLLRINLSQDYWNDVLKSSIWELTNVEVQPALLLSYRYLSAPLKGCLAYCSIFPKNSIFKKKMVVQLWIAEGLVRHPESQKSWEKVGGEYFDELVSRSLIHQRSVDDGEASFEMHDLINDLVTMISSPYYTRLDEQKLHERVRHLSYKRGQYDSYNKFDKFYALKDLRTFLSLPLQEPRRLEYSVSDKVVHDLLPSMKQLHVLSLSNYMSITELPKAIGNLVYLRYLNLSYTGIHVLPSEICKLYNLQTLLLSYSSLRELPKDIGKLVNLRHLDITNTSLRKMPAQIARLENLQTLSDFVVGKQDDGLKVAELAKFLHLEGRLSISELHNVTEPSDAFQASLKTKERVCELDLKWDQYASIITQGLGIQGLVLEQLQPSTNLKKLNMYGYGGTNFPNWLGDSSFGNMVYLCISDCHNCSWLPPLGQLGNLEKLDISDMKSVKSVGAEFYGSGSGPSFQPFPSLDSLSFCGMPEWEEWNLIGGTAIEFPCLRNLSVLFCPKLKGNIPNNLPSLTELMLWSCPRLKGNVLNDLPSLSGDSGDEVLMPIEEISQWVLPLNSLQHLTIEGFPSLKYFPRDGLPKTLKSLCISRCENLEFLARESLHNYTSLEDLKLLFHSCCSMTSFTLGSLPVLKHLLIRGCKELKSILIAEDASQQSLSFLRSITIGFCDELESFPPGGLPTPNLAHLDLSWCKKLHSLPEPMNTLIGLQELRIDYLTNLQSFPKEGFPINIRKLALGNFGGIMQSTSIAEWGFERLTCLDTLRIADNAIVKALMKIEVPLLPASLVSLEISDLYGIERLDVKWLQNLTSLKELTIHSSYYLKSLSEEGLLPSSISVLRIKNCPLLEARWRRKRGKEWRKVARIPSIVVNDKLIT